MAEIELNLITAASMGDVEAVKRLIPFEEPGKNQRQTVVFAAFKNRAACVELLIPLCSEESISDAFCIAVQEHHAETAMVLFPHIVPQLNDNTDLQKVVNNLGVCAIAKNDREMFNTVFPWLTPPEQWVMQHQREHKIYTHWFEEECNKQQKRMLEEHVADCGRTSVVRKL